MPESPAARAKQFSSLAEELAASLEADQARLDETKKQQEVLDKQVAVSRATLTDLDTQIEEVTEKYEAKIREQNAEIDYNNEITELLKKSIHDFKTDEMQFKYDIEEAKAELLAVNTNIRDRKLYLDEQEETINQTVETWNDHLTSLKTQLRDLDGEKSRSLEQLLKLESDRDELGRYLEGLNAQAEKLEADHQLRIQDLEGSLGQYDSQITERQSKLNEMEVTQKLREQDLVTREESVKLKEIVQAKTEREQQQREKKLRMDYNLAGQAYD